MHLLECLYVPTRSCVCDVSTNIGFMCIVFSLTLYSHDSVLVQARMRWLNVLRRQAFANRLLMERIIPGPVYYGGRGKQIASAQTKSSQTNSAVEINRRLERQEENALGAGEKRKVGRIRRNRRYAWKHLLDWDRSVCLLLSWVNTILLLSTFGAKKTNIPQLLI